MAVLRATQLFVYKCSPTRRDVPVPVPPIGSPRPDAPELQAAETVYTVPAGKRAIIRSFMATLGNVPPTGTEPNYWVQLSGPGLASTYYVHWFWFVDHAHQIGVWRLHDTWSPMLVMNEGQQLHVTNLSPQFLSIVAGGHLLNMPA